MSTKVFSQLWLIFTNPVSYINFITGGDDYTPGPFTATIPAGQRSVTFNISITDDNVFELNEDFTLTVDSSSLPTGVSVPTNCLLVVMIENDDGKLPCRNNLPVIIARLI